MQQKNGYILIFLHIHTRNPSWRIDDVYRWVPSLLWHGRRAFSLLVDLHRILKFVTWCSFRICGHHSSHVMSQNNNHPKPTLFFFLKSIILHVYARNYYLCIDDVYVYAFVLSHRGRAAPLLVDLHLKTTFVTWCPCRIFVTRAQSIGSRYI